MQRHPWWDPRLVAKLNSVAPTT